MAKRTHPWLAMALIVGAVASCQRASPRTELPNPEPASIIEHEPSATDPNQAKFETPEQVFAAAQAAAKDNDVAKIVECHTIESQEGLTTYTLMATAMMRLVADKLAERGDDRYVASRARVDAVLAKHGVDISHASERDIQPDSPNSAVFREVAKSVVNRPVFLAELIHELEAAKGAATTGFQDELFGELVDVTIDGTSAEASIAQVTADGNEVRKPIRFKKTDDGWRIHMPTD
jgi:hypothetical protein